MTRLRPYPVAALAAWTLFTWGNRIHLAWGDDTLDVGEKVAASVPVAIFCALGIGAVLVVLRSGAVLVGRGRLLVRGLAAWTIVYWAVRLPLILLGGASVGFEVVHAVLATVSVTLGVASWRATAAVTGKVADRAKEDQCARL
jgi:hypothetical protein